MQGKVLYSAIYGEGVECSLVLLPDLSMDVICGNDVVYTYPSEVYENMPKGEKWVCEGFLEFALDDDLLLGAEFLELFKEMEEYNEQLLLETPGYNSSTV